MVSFPVLLFSFFIPFCIGATGKSRKGKSKWKEIYRYDFT